MSWPGEESTKFRGLKKKKKQHTHTQNKVIHGWSVDPPINLKTAEAVVGRHTHTHTK